MPDQQILASYRDFLYGIDGGSNCECVSVVWTVDQEYEDLIDGELQINGRTLICVANPQKDDYLAARLAAEKIRRAVDKFIEGLDKAEALSRWEGK